MVLELLECGADPNQADKVRGILQCQYVRWLMILSLQNGWTALFWASMNGHDEIVRVLLAAKATVNTQIKVGLLHFPQHAVYIVFLLCTVGRDPSLGSQFQWSPEMYGAPNRCWGQC